MLYSTYSIYYLSNFDFYRTFFLNIERHIMIAERNGYVPVDYKHNTNDYIFNLHPTIRHLLNNSQIVEKTEDNMMFREDTAKIHKTWYAW